MAFGEQTRSRIPPHMWAKYLIRFKQIPTWWPERWKKWVRGELSGLKAKTSRVIVTNPYRQRAPQQRRGRLTSSAARAAEGSVVTKDYLMMQRKYPGYKPPPISIQVGPSEEAMEAGRAYQSQFARNVGGPRPVQQTLQRGGRQSMGRPTSFQKTTTFQQEMPAGYSPWDQSVKHRVTVGIPEGMPESEIQRHIEAGYDVTIIPAGPPQGTTYTHTGVWREGKFYPSPGAWKSMKQRMDESALAYNLKMRGRRGF